MSLKPRIDSGRFRAPCATCDGEIPRGHARLAETVNEGRVPNARYQYHHFECGLERHPQLVRQILHAEQFEEGLISDPSGLNSEIQDRIDAREHGKPAPPRRILVDPDPRAEQLLRQLTADPTDRDTLAVLADALAERGDPRGELIVLDLSLGSDEGDDDQEDQRRNLRNRLLPRICRYERAHAEVTWGTGFIEHVAVREWNEWYAEPFRDPWTHGSLRLLQTLSIGGNPGDWLVGPLPALRRLTISRGKLDKLPALPSLVELDLEVGFDREGVNMLATMLDGRKLARIDARNSWARPEFYGMLAELCDELVT